MRQTRQREVILGLVLRGMDHPTAAQVFDRARKELPSVGYATVYRTLGALVDEGRLRALRVGDVTQYDRRTDRHDHLVCRQCGKVCDVEVPIGAENLSEIEAESGFSVDEYHVEIFGSCAECRPLAVSTPQ